MYSIEQFRCLNGPEAMVLTQHSRKRFAEPGISVDDIQYVFRTGEIIEQYPDDKPFPSCLILGCSGERALHVVASIDDDLVYGDTSSVCFADSYRGPTGPINGGLPTRSHWKQSTGLFSAKTGR